MLCPLLISAWGKKTFLVHHSYEKDDFSVSDRGSLEEKNANYNRSRTYELLPLSLTEKSSFSYKLFTRLKIHHHISITLDVVSIPYNVGRIYFAF